MIARSKFLVELNEIELFLEQIELLDDRNYSPSIISDVSEFRKSDLIENWQLLIKRGIYDFQLKDNSILSFKIDVETKKASYLFIECPYNCLTYDEFINDELGYTKTDHDRTFINEYNLYVQQTDVKKSSVYIRFDLDYDSYVNGLHPVAHLHIGFRNQLRIAINKILIPSSFLNFILRHHYTANWKSLLETIPKNDWIIRHEKHKTILPKIETSHFRDYDLCELYLD